MGALTSAGAKTQDGSAGGGGRSLRTAELEFALDSLCKIVVGGCDLPILKSKRKISLIYLNQGLFSKFSLIIILRKLLNFVSACSY